MKNVIINVKIDIFRKMLDNMALRLRIEINDIEQGSLKALKSYTFGADLFGKTRDKSIISLRNDKTGSKEGVLKDTLFPKAEKIEERYKFIKGRKYLLPAAWIARGFVNLKEIPQNLMTEDDIIEETLLIEDKSEELDGVFVND